MTDKSDPLPTETPPAPGRRAFLRGAGLAAGGAVLGAAAAPARIPPTR
jgi:hypothetical protein